MLNLLMANSECKDASIKKYSIFDIRKFDIKK
jgi:hypothetical protein